MMISKVPAVCKALSVQRQEDTSSPILMLPGTPSPRAAVPGLLDISGHLAILVPLCRPPSAEIRKWNYVNVKELG